MGLFDFLRRRPRAIAAEHEPSVDRLNAEADLRRALDDALGRGHNPDPATIRAVELREQAYRLQERIQAAETRENTPANAVGHEVANDVMLSDLCPGPTSYELQDDLGLVILSDPSAFVGTPFEMSEALLAAMREELLERELEQTDQAEHPSIEEPEA